MLPRVWVALFVLLLTSGLLAWPSHDVDGTQTTRLLEEGDPTGYPTSFVLPTSMPSTSSPSGQPSRQPTRQPTSQPSRVPSGQPTRRPTSQPSSQPTRVPSGQPTTHPSSRPSAQPISHPSCQPTRQPTSQPSRQPTSQPSRQPSRQPTGQPSRQPSRQPTRRPSRQPTGQPSRQPTRQPTSRPTIIPSGQPTRQPSSQPVSYPSMQPSGQPSHAPSSQPVGRPTRQPTGQPSSRPSQQPTTQPSKRPTGQPSRRPSRQPSRQPTRQPTRQPSRQPTRQPTRQPSTQPSHQPTRVPTGQPSRQPTSKPSRQPSNQPTSKPSAQPSTVPSGQPSSVPTTSFPSTNPYTTWEYYMQAIETASLIKNRTYGQGVPAMSVVRPQQFFRHLEIAGQDNTGSCSDWANFLSGDVATLFSTRRLLYIELIVASKVNGPTSKIRCNAARPFHASRLNRLYGNYFSLYNTNASIIVGALLGNLHSNVLQKGGVIVECDTHVWHINAVHSATAPTLTTSLCIDCFNANVSTNHTVIAKHSAHPHKINGTWFGNATFVPFSNVNSSAIDCNLLHYYLQPCNNPCLEPQSQNDLRSNSTIYSHASYGRVLNIVFAPLQEAPSLHKINVTDVTSSSITMNVITSEDKENPNDYTGSILYCLALEVPLYNKSESSLYAELTTEDIRYGTLPQAESNLLRYAVGRSVTPIAPLASTQHPTASPTLSPTKLSAAPATAKPTREPTTRAPTLTRAPTMPTFAPTTAPTTTTLSYSNTQVSIYGLTPSTNYTVFCIVESKDGLRSNLATAMAKRAVETTACCKSVTISYDTSTVRIDPVTLVATYTDLVFVVVDSPPANGPLTVSFSSIFTPLVPYYTKNHQYITQYVDYPFSPSLFVFAENPIITYKSLGQWQRSAHSVNATYGQYYNYITGNFSQLPPPTDYPRTVKMSYSNAANMRGSNSMDVELLGNSASEYKVTYVTTNKHKEFVEKISIITSTDPMPAPEPRKGTLSTDGTIVTVTFDKLTNRGALPSKFPCSSLFVLDASSKKYTTWFTESPTSTPSMVPGRRLPSCFPTSQPSGQPTGVPSRQPSSQPSKQPTRVPTSQPSRRPSRQPTSQPTRIPTGQPIVQPTRQPTSQPSRQPNSRPTQTPTSQPTMKPSRQPSRQPTSHPSRVPSSRPSRRPTNQPTRKPTGQPSRQPTRRPSGQPSRQPSRQPTRQPSRQPSWQPTSKPSRVPTSYPTELSMLGAVSSKPTSRPTSQPISPTSRPTGIPTSQPTSIPTSRPSSQPSEQPSGKPSGRPSRSPTGQPSRQPTRIPSRQPTGQPSRQPSGHPSMKPSRQPTGQPSRQPSRQPTMQPSRQPSRQPTMQPSSQPVGRPTSQPSRQPTSRPSRQPSSQPSMQPSRQPSGQPSRQPSRQPSGQPSSQPVQRPSSVPSSQPTVQPTRLPTGQPSSIPTLTPTYNQNAVTPANIICTWLDSYNVALFAKDVLRLGGTYAINSHLLIKENVLRAQCVDEQSGCTDSSLYPFAPSTYVQIDFPSVPVTPIINIPSLASVCETISVDLRNSLGSLGRPWTSYVFRVTTNNTVADAVLSTANAAKLTHLLTSASPFTDFPFVIPSSMMVPGWYHFTVTMCNILNTCGASSSSLVIVDTAVPLAHINGPSELTISTNSLLSLGATLQPSLCKAQNGSDTQTTALAYSWFVQEYWANNHTETIDFKFHNPSSPYLSVDNLASAKGSFVLAPFTLRPSSRYSVILQVTNTLTLRSSRASVTVYVSSSKLVAVIMPSEPTQTIYEGNSLLLDASRSYDNKDDVVAMPNLMGRGLNFTWSCSTLFPVPKGTCDFVLTPTTLRLKRQGAQLVVSAPYKLPTNTRCLITLTVFDHNFRYATASVAVSLLPNTLPFLQSISNSLGSATKANLNDALLITATFANITSDCIVTWSSLHGQVNLASTAATALSIPLSKGTLIYPFNLLLPPGSLPPSTFTFVLSATSTGQVSSYSLATMTVVTNAPPTPGSFVVKPKNGLELSTLFSLVASGWADADIPLSYQFGFAALDSQFTSLSSRTESQNHRTILGAAPSTSDPFGRTIVSVQVYDFFLANSSLTFRTLVSKTPTTSSSVKLVSTLVSNIDANSPASIHTAVGVASSVLNRVDCSGATACASLNRKACTTTPNTCGGCIDYVKYFGEIGPANTQCFLSSLSTHQPHRRTLDITTTPVSTTNVCHNTRNCPVFQTCNTTSFTCILDSKACPDGCSANGQCVFVNIDVGVQVSSCQIGNSSCIAKCACYYGFYGASCAYQESDWNKKQKIRSKLLDQLRILTALESAALTRDVWLSWVAGLTILTDHADELPSNASTAMHSLLIKTFTTAIALKLPFQSIASMMTKGVEAHLSLQPLIIEPEITSQRRKLTVFSVASIAANTSALAFVQSAHEYAGYLSTILSNSVVLGQPPATFISSNFRIVSQKIAASQIANNTLTLQTPLTVTEAKLGMLSPFSVTLGSLWPNVVPSNAIFGITIIVLRSSLYQNPSLTSDSIEIKFDAMPCPPSGCFFNVVLPNHFPVGIGRHNLGPGTWNYTFHCPKYSTESWSVTCPNGEIAIANCTQTEGTLFVDCAHTIGKSPCNIISTSSNALMTNTSQCKLVEATYFDTTCQCKIGGTISATSSFSSSHRYLRQEAARGLAEIAEINTGLTFITTSVSAVSNYYEKAFPTRVLLSPVIVIFSPEVSWLIIYCFSSVGGIFFLVGISLYSYRKWNEKRNKDQSAAAATKIAKEKKIIATKTTVQWEMLAVDKSLPAVLREGKFINRFFTEIKVHHRWFSIFFFLAGASPYPIKKQAPFYWRILSIGTHAIVPLFVLITLYQFIDADDGTCEAIRLADVCPQQPAYLTYGIFPMTSRCAWSTSDNICHALHPTDLVIIIQLAIYASTVSGPIAAAAEYVYMRIVGLPGVKISLNDVADATTSGSMAAAAATVAASLKAAAGGGFGNTSPNKYLTEKQFNAKESNHQMKLMMQMTVRDKISTLVDHLRFHMDNLRSVTKQRLFIEWWGLTPSLKALRGFDIDDGVCSRLYRNNPVLTGTINVNAFVADAFALMDRRLTLERAKFVNLYATKAEKRQRMVYLFIRDFMASEVHKHILDTKEFRDSDCPPTGSGKEFGWMYITMLNMGLGFCLYMFRNTPGLTAARQSVILQSYMVLIVIEVLFSSTLTTYFIHYAIPQFVMDDLGVAKQLVIGTIRQFGEANAKKEVEVEEEMDEENVMGGDTIFTKKKVPFNAASYFFISSQLAALYPDVSDSKLITWFSSENPPRTLFAFMKQQEPPATLSAFVIFALASTWNSFVGLGSYLVFLPVLVQDMLVHFLVNFSGSCVALGVVVLWDIYPALIVLPVMGFAFFAHFVIVSGKSEVKMRLQRYAKHVKEDKFDYNETMRRFENAKTKAKKSKIVPDIIKEERLIDVEESRAEKLRADRAEKLRLALEDSDGEDPNVRKRRKRKEKRKAKREKKRLEEEELEKEAEEQVQPPSPVSLSTVQRPRGRVQRIAPSPSLASSSDDNASFSLDSLGSSRIANASPAKIAASASPLRNSSSNALTGLTASNSSDSSILLMKGSESNASLSSISNGSMSSLASSSEEESQSKASESDSDSGSEHDANN